MKFFVALAALLTAAPTIPQTEGFKHNEAAIVRVYCERPNGAAWGTAFKITTTQYITARHVVQDGTCYVDGKRVTMLEVDERHDYATFDGPPSPDVIEPSCEGFHRGQTYIARGFAGGMPYNTFSPQTAFPMTLNGYQTFAGEEIRQGMSGGPMIDAKGRVQGFISMRWPNRSMPLSSTGLCRK